MSAKLNVVNVRITRERAGASRDWISAVQGMLRRGPRTDPVGR